MKKLVFLFATFVMLFSAAPILANASTGNATVAVDKLNVRENPSKTARVIGSLPKRKGVYVYETNSSGWSKIKFNNTAGYVATGHLKFPGSPSTAPVTGKEMVVNASKLHVRATPSPKGKIIGSYSNGTKVYVYSTRPGGWAEVRYNGKVGFVASAYLKAPQSKVTYEYIGEFMWINASSLNVRATPSPKGKVIGSLPRYANIYVVGVYSNGWAEIVYKENPAYVSWEYLELY
ncbi:SH3 domain-containing protein [Bacillus sp. FJAT-27231]|uniref:SH3 domain-containing protein n=1 Tax=Bacillus sp. FJAT-27231 TaxID=1679168 RepID=UPI0006712707|nr:SH3 domain-containing protein [Bacillus sp. FJAT-27231]